MAVAVRKPLVAAAFGMLALAGCAHGHTTPSPSPSTGGGRSGPTQEQLDRALLTKAELPLGFQQQDGAAEAMAIGCAGIDQLYLARDTSAHAAVSFGHATSSAFVNETITLQPGKAAANMDAFRRAARECGSFAGAGQMQYRVALLAGIPAYGDGTAAVRITARLAEARPVELVAVRMGDVVVLVAHAEAGAVDTDLTRTIVSRAVAKIRRML